MVRGSSRAGCQLVKDCVVHELGHFLDQQALGANGGFGSESGRIPGVIADTSAVRRLLELQTRKQVLIRAHGRRDERFVLDQTLISYLLEPKELFARAYAQYVAMRSIDARLAAQLDAARRDVFLGMVYPHHWNDEGFAPVARVFEQMLWRRRWIE